MSTGIRRKRNLQPNFWRCGHCRKEFHYKYFAKHMRPRYRASTTDELLWSEKPANRQRIADLVWYGAYGTAAQQKGVSDALKDVGRCTLSTHAITALLLECRRLDHFTDIGVASFYCSDECVEPHDVKAVRLSILFEKFQR